jgi:NDP-hexose 2,3-enoyl reductase
LETCQATIEEYERFCAEAGRDPAEVGLAWVASRPGVTALIAGPRTVEHIDGAITALEAGLSDDELARLDELFPALGQGGPAPGAWIT